MKQLQDLESRVKAIVSRNSELENNISLLVQETEVLAAKLIEFAQQNAELSEKVAALEKENAALSIKFDEAQTQAIQGMDAVVERDLLNERITQLLSVVEVSPIKTV